MGPRKNVLDSSRRERKGGWRGPGIVVISQFRNPRIQKLLVGCISGTLRRKGYTKWAASCVVFPLGGMIDEDAIIIHDIFVGHDDAIIGVSQDG